MELEERIAVLERDLGSLHNDLRVLNELTRIGDPGPTLNKMRFITEASLGAGSAPGGRGRAAAGDAGRLAW